MNANGKKTGFRVAALLAVAGATMAMAAAPSSSEGVALDQVVMVNKDAPQQQGRNDSGGSGDRGLLSGGLIGEGIIDDGFVGAIVTGNIADDGNLNGNIGDGSLAGNVSGNVTGNLLGD